MSKKPPPAKHEFFLLCEQGGLEDARSAKAAWMDYYNTERPHATLGNMVPAEYRKCRGTLPQRFFQRFFRSGTAPKSLRKWLDNQFPLVV